jgi:glycosyltransferase involved in cell wall biosynthesis
MFETSPISAQILTWNSEKTLSAALESVRGCKEILIIDGGSTDDTLRIAKSFNARIIPQRTAIDQGKPLLDFAEARNQGLLHTQQPWILCLDSDEKLSEALKKEVFGIAQAGSEPAAYYVPRRYTLPNGKVITHASTYPNERIYFFHRDAVERWEKPIHERIKAKPRYPIHHLKGWTEAPLGTLNDYWKKNKRYMEIELKKYPRTWGRWFGHRLPRALRGQIVSAVKLLWIWLLPWPGKRLPLSHEFTRWKYRWMLVWKSCPLVK